MVHRSTGESPRRRTYNLRVIGLNFLGQRPHVGRRGVSRLKSDCEKRETRRKCAAGNRNEESGGVGEWGSGGVLCRIGLPAVSERGDSRQRDTPTVVFGDRIGDRILGR